MKDNKIDIKKVVIFLFCVFLYLNVNAQDSIITNKIVYVGSSELVNGVSVITLDKNVKNYYVSLTPIDNFSQLYIDKNENGFIVKSKDQINTKFDFIVIEQKIKYKENIISNEKN